MKSLVVLVALSGVANAEQVDRPAVQRSATYSLDIGSHVRTFGDTSAAILATDTLSGPRLTIGRSLTSTRVPYRELDIGVFARYVYASVDGQFFQTLDTNIAQHAVTGGVRIDAPLLWRTRLIAQAEAGMARTALQVSLGETMPVDDKRWAPYAAATLGADLGLVDTARFRLGLGVDVGYVVTVPVDLRALPADRPDEQLSIATEFASIGKLDTRGWVYSMTVRGAF